MAKGQKRKMGVRQPNGQLRRPTVGQRTADQAEKYRKEMAQVANQPHRRGTRDPLSPRLENALGRFCERRGLRDELYDAGHEWAGLMRRWRSAKGVPDPQHTGGMGSGQGPSDATVQGWRRTLSAIDSALLVEGRWAYFAARQICIDSNDLGADQEEAAIMGLQAVAIELGRVSRKEAPFRRAA